MSHLTEDRSSRVVVAGVGARGSGYPNAWNTIRILRQALGIEVVESGRWLPATFRLWAIARQGRLGAFATLAGIVLANAISALGLLQRGAGAIVYVPYPSVFLLWLLSWVPRRWRPRCICDAYITVWDALYQDRRMADRRSTLAKVLLRIESRALRASDRVLVDTTANATQVARLFGVSPESIVTAPLALDEGETAAPVALPRAGTVRVLFVGTFVPLQGTLVVAEAIHQLRDRDDIEFVVIGEGQQAEAAAPLLQGNPRVRWIRDWQTSATLAGHMAAADICLGVFGGEGKAGRVLPFKVYHALARGKAVVTQCRYGTPGTPPIPCELVPPSAEALAEAIVALAGDAERRRALGQAARRYYLEHLDDAAVARAWRTLLAGLQA